MGPSNVCLPWRFRSRKRLDFKEVQFAIASWYLITSRPWLEMICNSDCCRDQSLGKRSKNSPQFMGSGGGASSKRDRSSRQTSSISLCEIVDHGLQKATTARFRSRISRISECLKNQPRIRKRIVAIMQQKQHTCKKRRERILGVDSFSTLRHATLLEQFSTSGRMSIHKKLLEVNLSGLISRGLSIRAPKLFVQHFIRRFFHGWRWRCRCLSRLGLFLPFFLGVAFGSRAGGL